MLSTSGIFPQLLQLSLLRIQMMTIHQRLIHSNKYDSLAEHWNYHFYRENIYSSNFSSYMTPEEVMQMQANGKGLKGVSASELKALMVIKI